LTLFLAGSASRPLQDVTTVGCFQSGFGEVDELVETPREEDKTGLEVSGGNMKGVFDDEADFRSVGLSVSTSSFFDLTIPWRAGPPSQELTAALGIAVLECEAAREDETDDCPESNLWA
jgi:hypothetical protein